MAFRLNVHLESFEFRKLNTGTGRKGPWMSLVMEDPEDASQVDVSVPSDMQGDVYGYQLAKGDKVTMDVVAFAGPEYSRVTLKAITRIVDVNGEIQLGEE